MAHEEHIRPAEALIEALPFIQKFRGHIFVIKYGGSAMEDEHAVERLLRDIVFLEAVGVNPVLVHGGGKAITNRMREAGLKPRFVAGLRVTDAQVIRIVQEVLDGEINPRLVETIREFGGQAAGISGLDVFRAKKLPPQIEAGVEVDLGFVGEVCGVEIAPVQQAVAREVVPVISPLGRGPEGEVLNVNADLGAGSLAGELKATKLIYVSDVPGVMRNPEEPDSLIPTVNRDAVRQLIKNEIITGGMVPKVTSAVNAIEAGVGAVHFIDGRLPHSLLLEIFTANGVGTEIVP